jgi:hypothetical protein
LQVKEKLKTSSVGDGHRFAPKLRKMPVFGNVFQVPDRKICVLSKFSNKPKALSVKFKTIIPKYLTYKFA